MRAPGGGHDEPGRRPEQVDDVLDRVEGVRVRPLQVFHEPPREPVPADVLEQAAEGLDHLDPVGAAGRMLAQLRGKCGESGAARAGPAAYGVQAFALDQVAQGHPDSSEGDLSGCQVDRLSGEHDLVRPEEPRLRLGDQAALADSRLSADQDRRRLTRPSAGDGLGQAFQLGLTSDQRRPVPRGHLSIMEATASPFLALIAPVRPPSHASLACFLRRLTPEDKAFC